MTSERTQDPPAPAPDSVHGIAADRTHSPLRKYQLLTVGTTRLWPLVRQELLLLLVNDLPGAAGLWLRPRLYRGLFGALGQGVVLGRGLTLRQPSRVRIGDRTWVDDWCFFKVMGGQESGISLGTDVFVGRLSSLNARGGRIEVGDHANIGANVRLGTRSRLTIGRHCIIAAFCYIGGADHRTDRTDIPIALQGMADKGGVVIEDDVWVGAGAVVTDGVRIGRGSVIGAGAVVTRDIPPYSVALGVPARVVRDRRAGPGGGAP